jgi:hypothetical protein
MFGIPDELNDLNSNINNDKTNETVTMAENIILLSFS